MTGPFWKTKSLSEMTEEEWESLCDGCGKCCLSKLEDEETGRIYWTSVACRLFDPERCRCNDYANRFSRVSDCIKLTPENVSQISWLPETCAYRVIAEGRDLEDWHPLLSGTPETVHKAGISVKDRITALESDLDALETYFDHVLDEEP